MKRAAYSLLYMVLLCAVLSGTVLSVSIVYFLSPGPLEADTTLVIPQGTSLKAMSEMFEEKSVIRHARLFWVVVGVARGMHSLKAGEYKFTAAMSPKQIMHMLVAGQSVVHRFTLTEGETTSQVLQRLIEEPSLTGEIPLGIEEGSLMPDTYFFSYGDQRVMLLTRMQKNMEELLVVLWATRTPGLPFATVGEAVIMASIVEKETGQADERGRVAAVFINRLRSGMKLQSDPTVIYAITEGKAPLPRALTSSDLRTVSPYNTYVVLGLPPKPIGNPGKAALMAVLNPPRTNEFYFVANGRGGHFFSSTLAEHNRNVQLYHHIVRGR